MLKRLFSIAAVLVLALLPAAASAQPVETCQVLIQFYNEGTPGTPGVSGDKRFGIRLNIPDVGDILLPANDGGYVRFYTTPDTVVPYYWVPLYLNPLTEGSGMAGEVSCGFTAIRVFAGT